jgi:hypothetical protein
MEIRTSVASEGLATGRGFLWILITYMSWRRQLGRCPHIKKATK